MSDRLAVALAELVEALREAVAASVVPPAPPSERVLSLNEAAARLGLGRTSTYREVDAGRLRTIKVGGRRLVPESSIAAWIEQSIGSTR